MFYALRRFVIVLFWCGVAAFIAVVYQKRAVFNPALAFGEALVMRSESTPKSLTPISGKVIKIVDSSIFQLRADEGGTLYSIGFAGVVGPPVYSTNKTDLAIKDEIVAMLNRSILSNHVQIDLTFLSEKRVGLGIVYLGTTNINASLVEGGLGRVKREYLKGLGVNELYTFLRAERVARHQERGFWKKDVELQLSATENPQ
jgi:endonuclease YncB( thermonuclease family)